jgi:hypothetical protein
MADVIVYVVPCIVVGSGNNEFAKNLTNQELSAIGAKKLEFRYKCETYQEGLSVLENKLKKIEEILNGEERTDGS